MKMMIPGCGSGVLGCLIAEYQSRSPQIDSMVVSISSAALVTGEGFAAIASDDRSAVTGEGETMLSRRAIIEKD